ncbi:MAG TPA: site-specific integrase [Micromonosporaceae bacterium]|nr:site-specific integrase [Micromonosporaceae bacterium]
MKSKGRTFKRCGCRNPATRRQWGQACPQLRGERGGWSRTHGDWHLQYELPRAADGTRRPLRDGAYPSQTDAEAALGRIRAALAVAEDGDTATLCRIGDIVDTAVKTGTPIPSPDELRRALDLDLAPSQLPTLAEYLPRWLKGRKTLKKGTWRSYEAHIRLYLIPYLGQYRIDRLRSGHIDAMYDAIDERNQHIATLRASRDPEKRAKVKGQRIVGPATQHRIHATLRKALNDAIRRDKLRTDNPALNVELPPAKAPKPMVWTAERVTAWRETGKIPSPVMVWTPQHTGTFLDHVHDANDRLYALYHLITFTGLRRGEACGVHWHDLDLDTATLTVRWQLVQHGWAVAMDTPKTDDSEATITLDAETVAVLRAHRTRQRRERLAAGSTWVDTGLVFTTDTGEQLHPADVTDHFHHLTTQAGLPPIRLHDLRHGAATMGLAAGVDMKVISKRLRHSSPTFTQKFYGAVLPELATAAAEATAAVVPRNRRIKTA